HDEALALFGEAIDGYLDAGRDRAAEVVCRQVIDAYPNVVRARRTLALIALGRGDVEEAAGLLGQYAETARQHGDDQLIRKSLRTMGLISGPGPVRDRAAHELDSLGDPDGAKLVREQAEEHVDAIFSGTGASWTKALHAALLGADELRKTRAG
ncbi:MAG: hypothetical protein ACOCUW_03695, partial [Gemmatimonadota bacterium]